MSAFRSLVPSVFGKNWWDAFKFPSRVMDQSFGVLVLESDLQEPRFASGKFLVPRTSASEVSSGFSEVATTEKEFRIRLDTTHFRPEEVQVRMVGKFVVVRGKHEHRATDGDGTVAREFTRRYMLPEGCDGEGVQARWDAEGALVITAPRHLKRVSGDRTIPIQKFNKTPAAEKLVQEAEKPVSEKSVEKPVPEVLERADLVQAVMTVLKTAEEPKKKEPVPKVVEAAKSVPEVAKPVEKSVPKLQKLLTS